MPITSWACPACNDPSAPLDHFESSAACAGVVDPAFAAAVLASDRERHHLAEGSGQVPQVHVTDGLSCPRKTAIFWQENVAVDPLKYTAIFRGQAVHGVMENHAPDVDGVWPECPVAGELAGVKVVGRIDRLHRMPSTGMIIDFKTPNDFSMRERKAKGAKPEDMAQVSMYADLVRQGQGWRPERGRIWYIFWSAHIGCDFPIVPIETAMDLNPYGCGWTVAQLLHMTSAALAGSWKDVPLVGESMTFGNADACSFCAVKGICWTQAKGAPV